MSPAHALKRRGQIRKFRKICIDYIRCLTLWRKCTTAQKKTGHVGDANSYCYLVIFEQVFKLVCEQAMALTGGKGTAVGRNSAC